MLSSRTAMVEETQKFGGSKKDGRLHLKKDIINRTHNKSVVEFCKTMVATAPFLNRFCLMFGIKPECACGNYYQFP